MACRGFRSLDAGGRQVHPARWPGRGDLGCWDPVPNALQLGVPLNACREFGLLKELSNPNVVKLYEVVVDVRAKELNVVLEWAEYDLSLIFWAHYQTSSRWPMPLNMIRGIMFQVGDWAQCVLSFDFYGATPAATRDAVHALTLGHASRHQACEHPHHR
jgi:hypothetical protein